MDTLAPHPRLRHAGGFLGGTLWVPIDGKMAGAASGKTAAVYNPATGGVIANLAEGDTADLDLAIVGGANAIFFNHGQCCCAGSRLLAHKSVYDKLTG